MSAEEPVDPDSLTGANWMSGIADQRRISEINLPGTHDSGTSKVRCGNAFTDEYGIEFAKCQSLRISEQLKIGIRYLDLRLSNDHEVRMRTEDEAKKGMSEAEAGEKGRKTQNRR